jgi:hypothetical protein
MEMEEAGQIWFTLMPGGAVVFHPASIEGGLDHASAM